MIKFEGKINGDDYRIECDNIDDFEYILDFAITHKTLKTSMEESFKLMEDAEDAKREPTTEELLKSIDNIGGYSNSQVKKGQVVLSSDIFEAKWDNEGNITEITVPCVKCREHGDYEVSNFDRSIHLTSTLGSIIILKEDLPSMITALNQL